LSTHWRSLAYVNNIKLHDPDMCVAWLYLRYVCSLIVPQICVLLDCTSLFIITSANSIKFSAISSINKYLFSRNFLSSNEDEHGNYFRRTLLADIINRVN
jgi:hypothetical protein